MGIVVGTFREQVSGLNDLSHFGYDGSEHHCTQ